MKTSVSQLPSTVAVNSGIAPASHKARVLVLSPHPDDEAIGCGGTLRRHSAAGADLRVIFLTSGERGSRVMPTEQIRQVREEEAAAAAAILGVSSMEFWREPDGELRSSAKLVSRIAQAIAGFCPDYLYATHLAEAHGDHRAAARLALRAVSALRGQRPVVRLFEVWTPLQHFDVLEEITEQIDAKRSAIRCYASQCANLPFDEASAALNRYRGLMHNGEHGGYAEAFVEIFAGFGTAGDRHGT
jgi:LmbE family N-acetylglucosaminyl deacetylase